MQARRISGFKIDPNSPFYHGTADYDACLVDWSASALGIKNGGFTLLNTYSDSQSDYLYTKKANSLGETSQDQIWVHMTGAGTPDDLPEMASTAAVAASGATITISSEISKLSTTYANKVQVWVGMVGGNGDAEGAMQLVDTVTMTQTGVFSYEYAAKIGAKIACKLVCMGVDEELNKSWTSGQTAVAAITLTDSATYTWNGNSGYWSDPGNWTCSEDTSSRLGYPSNGGKFQFRSHGTYTVYVDGQYSGFGWNNELGWGNENVTFLGTVSGASITCTGIDCYDGVRTTLSNVVMNVGSYYAKANGGLTLIDGSAMNSTWAGGVDGENAYINIGDGCTFATGVGENWHIGKIAGANATVVVADGGTFSPAAMTIGGGNATEASPVILRIEGTNAVVQCRNYLKPKFHGVAVLRTATPCNIYRGLRVMTTRNRVPVSGNASSSRRAIPLRAG